MELPKLEIISILQQDVEEIFSSRQKSKVLHKSKDIDASGDEIENSVRRVIRRKLPLKYYVSQGHIVDEKLQTSSQQDLIIADNTASPVLFTSENGTEYFPFESIYTFAEIKSTYYSNKKYVDSFIKSTTNIYEKLNRKETPHNQLSQDIALDFGNGISFTVHDNRPYKNPLFKFMFFVDSNDFKINDIKDLLIKTDDKYLPNLICFLEKGIIVKANIISEGNEGNNFSLGPIELFPQFIKSEDLKNYKWVFLEFGSLENRAAANFAFLIFALNTHLKNCLVLKPDLLKYFDGIFTNKGEIIG